MITSAPAAAPMLKERLSTNVVADGSKLVATVLTAHGEVEERTQAVDACADVCTTAVPAPVTEEDMNYFARRLNWLETERAYYVSLSESLERKLGAAEREAVSLRRELEQLQGLYVDQLAQKQAASAGTVAPQQPAAAAEVVVELALCKETIQQQARQLDALREREERARQQSQAATEMQVIGLQGQIDELRHAVRELSCHREASVASAISRAVSPAPLTTTGVDVSRADLNALKGIIMRQQETIRALQNGPVDNSSRSGGGNTRMAQRERGGVSGSGEVLLSAPLSPESEWHNGTTAATEEPEPVRPRAAANGGIMSRGSGLPLGRLPLYPNVPVSGRPSSEGGQPFAMSFAAMEVLHDETGSNVAKRSTEEIRISGFVDSDMTGSPRTPPPRRALLLQPTHLRFSSTIDGSEGEW